MPAQSERQTSDEIMTLSEIARYLKVSDKTILRMVRNGQIPGTKVANQWRFMRPVINDWLAARMRNASDTDLANVLLTGNKLVPVPELITPDRIVPDLRPGSNSEMLRALIKPLVEQGIVRDGHAYLEELLAREEMVSTAIGNGVALPHVREPGNVEVRRTCMVLGTCKKGVDFAALDGEPTYVFVLPCSNSEVVHLRLMAKITFILRQPGMVESLQKAEDKDEIHNLLKETHQQISITI
jgi:PTS system nitrogen regulatory IIA component